MMGTIETQFLKQIGVKVVIELMKRRECDIKDEDVNAAVDMLRDPKLAEEVIQLIVEDTNLQANFVKALADTLEHTLGSLVGVLAIPFELLFKKKD